MEFLKLPHCMIENIFKYLTYDEIAVNRSVCVLFNQIGGQLLNRGFTVTEKRHSAFLKKIKAQLPRRESERRSHPLGRHCEILWCIETRLSILNTCYLHFSERSLCCFIPGKILDEVNKLISTLQKMDVKNLPHANILLQELRDLCSMAVEHFRDKISPELTNKLRNSYRHESPFNHTELEFKSVTPIANKLQNISQKINNNFKVTKGLHAKYRCLRKQVNNYKTLASSQNRQIRILRNTVYKIQNKMRVYETKYGLMDKSECNRIFNEPEKPITKPRNAKINLPFHTLDSNESPTSSTSTAASPVTVRDANISAVNYIKHLMRKSFNSKPTYPHYNRGLVQTLTKRRDNIIKRPHEATDSSETPLEKRKKLDLVTITGTNVPVIKYIKHIMRSSTDYIPVVHKTDEPITKPRNAKIKLPFHTSDSNEWPTSSTPTAASSVTVRDANSTVNYIKYLMRKTFYYEPITTPRGHIQRDLSFNNNYI